MLARPPQRVGANITIQTSARAPAVAASTALPQLRRRLDASPGVARLGLRSAVKQQLKRVWPPA
jgi:hypothetical protein